MQGALVGSLVLVLLLVPTAVAPPPAHAQQGGLANACQQSGNPQPCALANQVPATTIGPGESKTYKNGTWTVTGDVTVRSGGTLTLDNATFRFRGTSDGILVEEGGTLRIKRSVLEPAPNEETSYVLDLQPGSTLLLNLTTQRGGAGLKLRTSDADVAGNSFEEIPLAVFLDGVSVTIHHNQFLDNAVALNQTGGANTLHANRFEGGEYCVRNWLTDPTITENVFRGCHVGILHQNSHSVLRANDMEDQSEPPGVGILVENTNSPLIEGNRIAKYGTGVIVRNATAYIRGNEIVDNVGAGVLIVGNTQPMDVTGNLIARNGGDGIHLSDAQDVEVEGNDIRDNAAYGLLGIGATELTVHHNEIHGNAVDGIALLGAPQAHIHNNTVRENDATGIVIGAGTTGAMLHDNLVRSNGEHGVFLREDGVRIRNVTASANALSGFALSALEDASLSLIVAEENGVDGMRIFDSSVEATDLVLRYNAQQGLLLEGSGERMLTRVNASGNGQDGIRTGGSGSNALVEPRAIGNAMDGLRHTGEGPLTASLAWWEDNEGAGVHNDGGETILETTCAYWGSPHGPTTSGNPEGDGDEAIGYVAWSPFRSTPWQTSCEPEYVY